MSHHQLKVEQNKWARKQNEDWLKNHGQFCQVDAKEIHQLVSTLQILDEAQELIVSGECCSIEHVPKLLSSLLIMISVCMSLDIRNESTLDLKTCVQYFLANYCTVVKSMNESNSKG